jgi:hypothetical protein
VCSSFFDNLPPLTLPIVYWCSEDRSVERAKEEYLWCKGITMLLDINKGPG